MTNNPLPCPFYSKLSNFEIEHLIAEKNQHKMIGTGVDTVAVKKLRRKCRRRLYLYLRGCDIQWSKKWAKNVARSLCRPITNQLIDYNECKTDDDINNISIDMIDDAVVEEMSCWS